MENEPKPVKPKPADSKPKKANKKKTGEEGAVDSKGGKSSRKGSVGEIKKNSR
jgi:hypothetical protein